MANLKTWIATLSIVENSGAESLVLTTAQHRDLAGAISDETVSIQTPNGVFLGFPIQIEN